MRFAQLTTAAAAIIAVPMAVQASSPQMSSNQFLSAVQCVAYESTVSSNPDLAEARWRLNTEATKQPAEVVARAQRAARAAAYEAPAACSSSQIADEERGERAV